jgi:hypothetical protein
MNKNKTKRIKVKTTEETQISLCKHLSLLSKPVELTGMVICHECDVRFFIINEEGN